MRCFTSLGSLPLTSLTSFLVALAVVTGCGTSHEAPRSDAGPLLDDAGPLLGDAGAPDAGGGPVTCDPVASDPVGEGCFCSGPLAVRDGYAYRQAIGIEVWDFRDPRRPDAVGHVDERAASNGALGVARGHLVSVRNFEPTLTVYALDDPRAPTMRAALALPAPVNVPEQMRVVDDFAVIVSGGGSRQLVGVDLSDLDAPRIAYLETLDRAVGDLTVDGERLILSALEPETMSSSLELRDLRTGTLRHRTPMQEGDASWSTSVAAHRGRAVWVDTDGLRVLELGPTAATEVARLPLPQPYVGPITVEGDLAALGGGALRLVDLADPLRPRVVPIAGETAIGDLQHLTLRAGVLYASSGNGMSAIELRCE